MLTHGSVWNFPTNKLNTTKKWLTITYMYVYIIIIIITKLIARTLCVAEGSYC